MADDVARVPSVRDLSGALLKLRERTGINLQKVWHATQLLELPVVLRQAEIEMREHELDAVAFELLECVLREGSHVLADRVRITIYTEYNFERTDSTYTDRKGQVLNRLDIRESVMTILLSRLSRFENGRVRSDRQRRIAGSLSLANYTMTCRRPSFVRPY